MVLDNAGPRGARPNRHMRDRVSAWPLEGQSVSRINFRTNRRKALEVILWCAQQRAPEAVDFHTVLKVLFHADVKHLNEWGRPVVGDDYMALPYGPVPQATYDTMKRDPLALAALGVDDVPFTVQGYHLRGMRQPDLTAFSESDLDALCDGWAKYGHLGFNGRTVLSHQHRAWRNAWEAGRQGMDWADFLDDENRTPERIADLADVAADLRL